MIERQNLIDSIIEMLTFLKNKVELSNPINLTDINVISENFYRDFLNLVYGYSLSNINLVEQNAAAVDLGDKQQKIAIQVTSTSTLAKTRKTVTGFIKKKLYYEYKRLIILNITSKSKHQDKFVGEEDVYQLNTTEDIWDVADIIKDICEFTPNKLVEICNFLKKEIKIEADPTLAKEIKTFMKLIENLSDEKQPSAGNGFLEEPDPDGKINKRFASYSDFLIKEYQDLYSEFGLVLKDVLQQSDMGYARIRRLGLHLKMTSDGILTECNGDPKMALKKLVENYSLMLSKNGIEYDESAIKFFLVDQLIKCNVFPNKVEVHG
jgi:hypothetical protein